MKPMTRGELAEATGVNIETLRYYERRGLVPQPPRSETGYRQYSDDYLHRLRFIRNAQRLGFSLAEVAELTAMRVSEEASCAEVKRKAEAKITDIEERIRGLQSIRRALQSLSRVCSADDRPVSDCRFLEELQRQKPGGVRSQGDLP